MDLPKLESIHADKPPLAKEYQLVRNRTVPIMKELATLPNIDSRVVLNCRPMEHVPMMFFNDCASAYAHIPKAEDLDRYADQGFQFIVMNDGRLPEHVVNRSDVLVVDGYW